MGVPGLGLLTSGLSGLKDKFQGLRGYNEDGTPKTQAQWEEDRQNRINTKRMGYLSDRKSKGLKYGKTAYEDLLSQGYSDPFQDAINRDLEINPETTQFAKSHLNTVKNKLPVATQTFSEPFKYGVGPVPPAPMGTPWDNPYKAPASPQRTSWDVPPGMMSDAYQNNLEFFDNLNKGIVKNNEPPMVNTDNVMQGSVLDAQPKKGIMQMISDAIFSPAGAAEMTKEDFEKFGAEKGFFGANDKLESMQEYYDAAKSLTTPGAKFAGANNPQAVRDFITQQSAIPFGGGSYSIDMENIPGGFLETTEDFTTQKDPYSYFANGGLASLFTRRG